MTVDLSPELEELIEKQVKSGHYSSASEVLQDALLLLEHRDELRGPVRKELQKKIALGLASLERGEGVDGEEFFTQLADEEALLETAPQLAQQGRREAL
jgi:antitoxin ParD1/3/4